jgi:hypothetical protein
MNEMNGTPFEQSSMQSTPLGESGAIEVRYPSAQRVLVPGILVLSAFIMPAVLFFLLKPPLNVVTAIVVALMEFSTAGFLWFVFNSAVVRADATGLTKSQLGQTKVVRWNEIASVETKTIMPSHTPQNEYILKDHDGKTLLQFSDYGDRAAGQQLLTYIERMIAGR